MNKLIAAILCAALLGASGSDVPAQVDRTIAAVLAKPIYAHSTFGLFVADQATGETLVDRNANAMFGTGSIMKVYAATAALKAYGPDYRFRTPVYRTGNASGGVLNGNLVLVASGDFSFGLRDRPDGTLAFNSFPQLDHNYADTGFPGAALVPDSRPLSALDELARKIRAGGIRSVRGDVVIDDRLFSTYKGWPDGLIAPIWVNENVIDITSTPTRAGEPAKLDWRPKTGAISVVSTVKTVAAGTKTPPLSVKTIAAGKVQVSGEIAADAKPLIVISQVPHPADFARVAFIEALRRAGVAVTASASGTNPVRLLPNPNVYAARTMVAQHVSPPLSQYVKVVLKISYNRGADLLVCLVAAKIGSSDCADGLAAEVKTIAPLGASAVSTIVYDGAGSVDDGRTTPSDEATLLRNLMSVPWGHYVHDGMSILGVDGTQATSEVGTPAAGKVRIKDGTRLIGSPSGQAYIPAKTQVGYIEAKSGRKLVYGIFFNGVPTTEASAFADVMTANDDEGAIVAAIQSSY